MTKKLTLSADEEVIETAKRLAAENNTTVSAMFARYIRDMAARRNKPRIAIGPITRKATGIVKLPKGRSDRDLLAEAVARKHGFGK